MRLGTFTGCLASGYGFLRRGHQRSSISAAQAQAKGEREREYHAREHDEEGLAHDVAADVDLVEGDEHHEGDDRVLGEAAEDVRVLDVDVAAIGGHRVADEAREVGAEGEDEECDHHLGQEQHHAPEQIGDVGEAEQVEADDQRGEDHQPVEKQRQDARGVGVDAAVAQEAVHAGALGEHVEVHRAQAAGDGETHRLGDDPAGEQHQQREHDARQELADADQEAAQRLERHFKLVHRAPPRMPISPDNGTCTQAGRLLIS